MWKVTDNIHYIRNILHFIKHILFAAYKLSSKSE